MTSLRHHVVPVKGWSWAFYPPASMAPASQAPLLPAPQAPKRNRHPLQREWEGRVGTRLSLPGCLLFVTVVFFKN